MINRLWKRIAVLGVILVVTVVLMVQVVAAQEITPYPGIIYISTDAAGMTDDGVAYDAYDIVGRVPYLNGGSPTADDAYAWFKLFDGEDYGLGSVHNINGFSIEWAEMVPCGGIGVDCVAPEPPASPLDDVEALYLSFDFTARHVPGITDKVRGQDIVVLHPNDINPSVVTDGDFEVYFDGSDVGLTTIAEKIDGLDVWPADMIPNDVSLPEDCHAGLIFVSTQGAYRVPTPGGSLVGDGSDILVFCATNLGNDTAGFWFRGFDSSELNVTPKHAITGIDVLDLLPNSPDGQVDDEAVDLLFGFIARQTFTADNAVGGPSELFAADSGSFIAGPADDFNQTWPALNGTATGLSLGDYQY